jgi:hypothetical protein
VLPKFVQSPIVGTNFPNKVLYGLVHVFDNVARNTTLFLHGNKEDKEDFITKGFFDYLNIILFYFIFSVQIEAEMKQIESSKKKYLKVKDSNGNSDDDEDDDFSEKTPKLPKTVQAAQKAPKKRRAAIAPATPIVKQVNEHEALDQQEQDTHFHGFDNGRLPFSFKGLFFLTFFFLIFIYYQILKT